MIPAKNASVNDLFSLQGSKHRAAGSSQTACNADGPRACPAVFARVEVGNPIPKAACFRRHGIFGGRLSCRNVPLQGRVA